MRGLRGGALATTPCVFFSKAVTFSTRPILGCTRSRVRDLSSGMRQRLALSLAFCTDASALFLDEPVSHLDRDGREWYVHLLDEWRLGRTLIVASNHNTEEYPKTAERLELGS